MTQNTLFVNQVTQTLHFTALMSVVEKSVTYALVEHDPGSAQDGKTASEIKSPRALLSPPVHLP